ncbi:Endosomal/prevacuolar sodium/hydrogen exchanger [Diplonema papillatum]|nr:Endosomal/prevacuolar sodium/hydrogen exchanger [Diplonema papillatum]
MSGDHAGSASEEVGEKEGSLIIATVCVIIVVAFVAMRAVQKYRLWWMSDSAMTILVGFALGSAFYVFGGHTYRDAIRFDRDTFTHFILPPIIFDAGFSLRHRNIAKHGFVISLLAILGTVVAAVVIGLCVKYFSKRYYVELYEASMWESMCFGAILSAIDPVAVIAVLGRVFEGPTRPRLFYVIFGESVFNDAVAVVLYKVFLRFLEEDKSLAAGSVFESILVFLEITILSTLIGWVTAACSAVLLKYVNFRENQAAELTILTLFGFGSYWIAEGLGMSGIMALFVSGRTSCHYTWHNMSTVGQVTAPQLFHFFAVLAETYVFAFLGLAFWSFEHEIKPMFTALVLLATLLSRFATVFPLVTFANALNPPNKRISLRGQLFMALTGLRGAISFGLALASNDNSNIVAGSQFVTTTLFVTCATVLVSGNLSQVWVTCLGLREEAAHEAEEAAAEADKHPNSTPAPRDTAAGSKPSCPGGCLERLLKLEKKLIAPFLRCPDHQVQHARRYDEIGTVLDNIQAMYDIKGPATDSRSAGSNRSQDYELAAAVPSSRSEGAGDAVTVDADAVGQDHQTSVSSQREV